MRERARASVRTWALLRILVPCMLAYIQHVWGWGGFPGSCATQRLMYGPKIVIPYVLFSALLISRLGLGGVPRQLRDRGMRAVMHPHRHGSTDRWMDGQTDTHTGRGADGRVGAGMKELNR